MGCTNIEKGNLRVTKFPSDISVVNKEVKSGTEVVLSCSVTNITSASTFEWKDSSGATVSSVTGDLDETGVQVSTITVTASVDEEFSCFVTNANSDPASETTVQLKVFGKNVPIFTF